MSTRTSSRAVRLVRGHGWLLRLSLPLPAACLPARKARAMPVTLRLRDVPRTLEAQVRDAIETVEGDWCITISQSHLDGQWHLQLEGEGHRCSVVIPPEAEADDLERVLQRLVKAASAPIRRVS